MRGIKEKKDEMLNEKIEDLIQVKLNMKIKVTRAERIGRDRVHGNRPTKVQVEKLEDRRKITDTSSKLKGTNIYIDRDYPQEVRTIRKILFKNAKELRAEDNRQRGFVSYDKLKINGVLENHIRWCNLLNSMEWIIFNYMSGALLFTPSGIEPECQ